MNNKFNKQVGYAPLNCFDENKLEAIVKTNKRLIDRYYCVNNNDLILVAGAGLGAEAAWIKKEFEVTTIGIDIHIQQSDSIRNDNQFILNKQDLMSLAFKENVFSFVYCYHVLEHVVDHIEVLNELNRVLKPGGILFIGFPNKNRMVSYIDPIQKVSIWTRIFWNINDYIYRVRGKFENKFGAHAGFSEDEFVRDAGKIFQEIHVVSDQYMKIKYLKYSRLIDKLKRFQLGKFIFPSNYFICKKG